MKTYQVNEIFYSIQGEGVRAGTPNVFLRFSGCNLTCKLETHGFDCDTEFIAGRKMTAKEICQELIAISQDCRWVVLTGGEPTLQVDEELVRTLHDNGWKLAIETNGTLPLPEKLDWICVSPKTAEHTLRIKQANELKYVRCRGQGIPRPSIMADHYLISPAFRGGVLLREDLQWCLQLVKDNPTWRLSLQLHNLIGVR